MIDWEKTQVLLNPRMPGRERIEALLEGQLADHLWFLTSGSTGQSKAVALSKSALFASAHAVNEHLQATKADKWVKCLPHFHVGGAGILARAYLSGSEVIDLPGKWDPAQFLLEAGRASLTALVPTQIYDLVKLESKAPPSLRGVVVGGGALSCDLYEKGKKLGWPLMPSYGLTECASQVATATKDSPELKLLPHIEAKVDRGLLMIKSPSLLTAYAFFTQENVSFEDPKKMGWFLTEDHASFHGDILEIQGRNSDFVKVGGESVDLKKLTLLVEELRGELDCALVAMPDDRLGHALHLVYTGDSVELFLKRFHERVLPFERIRQTHFVPAIPRSPLGKLLRGELTKRLSSKNDGGDPAI